MFRLLKCFRESLEKVNKYLPKEKVPDAKRVFYLAQRGIKTKHIQIRNKTDY